MRVRRTFWPLAAAVLLLCLAGCDSGGSNPPADGGQDADASDLDGQDAGDGQDGADGFDGGNEVPAPPSHVKPVSASGKMNSPSYQGTFRVGGPLPSGTTEGPQGRVAPGTGAAP